MMYYKGNRLPKITTELADYIPHTEVKAVKTFIKETTPMLEDYLIRMLDKSAEDLNINWYKIFEVTATYFDDYALPVLMISGLAFDRSDGSGSMFIEAYTNEDQGTIHNRFIKTA